MSSLLNSYPIFENNQVLTSAQLNELVAYLDEQNRLTRVKLLGDGIACGFDLQLNTSVSPIELTIFKGMGITSLGFLITEGDCVVKRYRDYNLPAATQYLPFEDPDTLTQDIKLYELLTDDAPVLPTDVIKFLDNPSGFLNDKIVMLFLETVDVDLKSCLTKSCDEDGKSRIFNLRKLLVSKPDADKIIARTCAQTSAFVDKYDLPEITMKKALFTNDLPTPNTSNYYTFSQTYINALSSTAKPVNNITIYNQIFSALKQTYVDFSPILSPVYGGVNPFLNFPSPSWTSFITGTSTGPKYLGMQYFYDFLKDLILAYNEFRDVAFDLMSECCIDMDCFPLHLFLGEVIAPATCKPSKYRHYFNYSPLFNSQNEKLKQAIMLHKRIVLMLNKFDLNTVNNPNTVIVAPSQIPVPIYITPSNEKRDPLSRRSIPYYYRIHETLTNLGTLEQSWNYDFKKKCLFSKNIFPLAYGNQDAAQFNDQGPIKTPLYYDTDPYNFFRIEGHIREDVTAAVTQIEKIKNDFDLPFNVITLRLAGSPPDNIAERCDFNDLRTEYGSIRVELLSLMKNVIDRFGSVVQGKVRLRGFPGFINALLNDSNTGVKNGSVTPIQIGFTNIETVSAAADSADAVFFGKAPAPVASAVTAAVFPLYAPQRTMTEVRNKLNTDLTELLETLQSLSTVYLPFNITNFNFGYTGVSPNPTPGFIQNYLNAVQAAIDVKVGFIQMLDLVLRSTKIKNTAELYMDLAAWWDEVVGLLEKFITDPRFKSLTLVNYTLQYRLNQLKANDMTLFSNFIKKHPGVEHKAGVQPGGTFIVLYSGAPLTIENPVREEIISTARVMKEYTNEANFIRSQDKISLEDQGKLDFIDQATVNFEFFGTAISIGTPVQQLGLLPNQIIADFSLPYLCCCDCECDSIDHPVQIQQLNIPTLALPFYVEYNLGDYAFGKDVDVWGYGCNVAEDMFIDIVPMLQYEKQIYQDTQIRLYLVDKNGNKVPVFSTRQQSDTQQVIKLSPMLTGNYPNQPGTGPTYGTAGIVYDQSFSTRQSFWYRPNPSNAAGHGFLGTDSFYYMFEIVDDAGNILKRSTTGKITINVTERCTG
jgi:hypothetical protein